MAHYTDLEQLSGLRLDTLGTVIIDVDGSKNRITNYSVKAIIEDSNLFLQFDSLGSRIELCSLGRELVQFYLIMVFVSIPDGVVML